MHIFRRRSGGLRGAVALLLSLAVAGLTAIPGAGLSAFASHSSQQKDGLSRFTRLSSASAIAINQGVLVRWMTSFELDNVGFNIYRVGSAGRLKLNREIIGGSVFIVGQ